MKESDRAVDMVGWKGALNFLRLDHDLALLYQLVKADDGWTISDLHMLLWGAEKNPRKDICRIGKFWKVDGTNLWNPEGNILWHASLDYSGRRDLMFVVVNAWMKDPFEEFTGVIDACKKVQIAGEKCYRIMKCNTQDAAKWHSRRFCLPFRSKGGVRGAPALPVRGVCPHRGRDCLNRVGSPGRV